MNKYLIGIYAVLILMVLALTLGCGHSNKILKTDIIATTSTDFVKIDTSARKTTKEELMNTVLSQIDQTKITITTYYQSIDSSTGKQPIKEVTVIDKNIKTDIDIDKQDSKTEISKSGITENTKQKSKVQDKSQIKDKKTFLPFKFYLIAFSVLAVIGYFAYRYIKNTFF